MKVRVIQTFVAAVIAILGLSLLTSCEEEFIIEQSITAEQYVVEGYVEAGEGSIPSFVLITKTVPFFDELGANEFASLFVDDASVAVNDGDKTVQFTKVCASSIPEGPIRDELSNTIGVDLDSVDVDICVYVDIQDQLTRDFGRAYDLSLIHI